MEFGLGPIAGRSLPEWSLSQQAVYKRSLQLAERAEAVGFDSAWFAEHHFAEDGYLPNPLSLASALASRTDSLTVGTGIAIAPLHHPLRLAETAAVIDNVAATGGGQFALGLGLGYRDVEFNGFSVPRSERVEHIRDTIDVCREAWSEGPMSVDGRRYEYPRADVRPKPASDIPVLVGANAKAGIARAARHADGFLALFNLSIDELEKRLSFARDILEEEDRDPESFDIKVFRTLFVHEDGEDAAWEAIEEAYMYERRKYLEWYLQTQDSHIDVADDKFEAQAEEAKAEWKSWVTCGTPDDIVAELERVNGCWDGEIEVITQLHYGGMDFDTAEEAVDLFGDRVIPRLESA